MSDKKAFKKAFPDYCKFAYYNAIRECYNELRVPFVKDKDLAIKSAERGFEKAIKDVEDWFQEPVSEMTKEDVLDNIRYDFIKGWIK